MANKFEKLTPACAGALFGIRSRLASGEEILSARMHKTIRKRLWESGLIYMRASADPLTPWGGGQDESHVFLTPKGEKWLKNFDEWFTGRFVRRVPK